MPYSIRENPAWTLLYMADQAQSKEMIPASSTSICFSWPTNGLTTISLVISVGPCIVKASSNPMNTSAAAAGFSLDGERYVLIKEAEGFWMLPLVLGFVQIS